MKQFLPLGKASSRLWFYIGGIVLAVIVVGLIVDYWPEHESVKTPVPVTALGGPAVQALSTLAPQAVNNNSASAEVNVLSVQPETEAENPFVQALASKPLSKSVPIVEARPVSPHKVVP